MDQSPFQHTNQRRLSTLHHKRPRQRVLVPQWNLGIVLSALNLTPFEQAEEVDLKFLSYKCCFLLALASGRRRSEVHAFSTSNSFLRFSRDKSSVTLLTDPHFVSCPKQVPIRNSICKRGISNLPLLLAQRVSG
jgi:hypothetical protein